jgi:dTDP-4-dehydrorhamnose reductase
MTNILVIGADGQLGHEIEKSAKLFPQFNFFYTTINDLDITDQNHVEQELKKRSYAFVINCAGYTDVNKSETETELAYKVNGDALSIIGKLTHQFGIKVIHISTDYVFDGTAHIPYKEHDKVNPQSVYGKSKLAGETNLLASNPQSIIIRTSWLYSTYGNNFVKTMLKLGKEKSELKVIFDQIGTPTFADDLALAILNIINQNITDSVNFKPGIYHYSNEGVCSWYDFTNAIFKLSKINSCVIIPIETSQYPSPAQRPHYSVLNKGKIKTNFDIKIPHWETSLKICLDELLNDNQQ